MSIKIGNDSYKPFVGSDALDKVYLGADLIYQVASGPKTFNDYTWSEIDAIAQAGDAATTFAIGDEKTVELATGEVITLVILGFDKDTLTAGGKAKITLGMKDVLNTQYAMYGVGITDIRYAQSAAAKSILPNIYNAMPSDLQNVIKPVNKSYSYSYRFGFSWKDASETISQDLWLYDSTSEIGTDYKIKHTTNGTAGQYFLRSSRYRSNSMQVYYVTTLGSIDSMGYAYPAYISFGLCI